MDCVVRNVRDLDPTDRSALEHVVGEQLGETQQVIIKVVNLDRGAPEVEPPEPKSEADVPDWWRIYEGLSDEEIDDLDQAIRQRADLTRQFE